MKKYFVLFSVCTIAVFNFSCGPKPNFSTDQTQRMDALITMAMTNYKVPGVIAAVWVPDKGTWIKATGYADKTTGQAMDPNMLFRIASASKTFTVRVILNLVQEGKLSLDDTIDKYITDPIIPNAHNITIRQVANMTSGLFEYTDDQTYLDMKKENPLYVWTPKEQIELALTHTPYFAPGTSWHYSNTNYIILGLIIEKITGNSVITEIQNRIIIPLGLSKTSFATTPKMPPNSSHGYSLSNTADENSMFDSTVIDPSCAWTAGAIISNIYDLKMWAQEFGTGSLISSNLYKEQLTWIDEPGVTLPFKYGLGTMRVGNFIGHEGSIDGFNISMMYLPSNGAVFIVVLNLEPGLQGNLADGVFAQLAKIVLPNDVSW